MSNRLKRTYVLVHGAWHGGWVWREVIGELRSMGHTVTAPTLTGLGERRHTAQDTADIKTHIEECQLIDSKGARVLVVDSSNKIRIKPVILGRDFGTKSEILGGLDATDRVVQNPTEALQEGMPVRSLGLVVAWVRWIEKEGLDFPQDVRKKLHRQRAQLSPIL